MDELRLLITLRNILRRWATKFHDLIEANEAAIEPDAVGTVRDLIEASMSTIDEMPIETPGGNDAPSGLTNRIKCLEMISPPQWRHD